MQSTKDQVREVYAHKEPLVGGFVGFLVESLFIVREAA